MRGRWLAACAAVALAAGTCGAADGLALVRDGRATAAFALPKGLAPADAKSVRGDVALFNRHLREVTGAELPTNGTAEATVELVVSPVTNLLAQFDWRMTHPDARTLRIEATPLSLMPALVRILEEGCDARFLGVEKCMFQFEPRRDVVLRAEPRASSPNGYRMLRSDWIILNHERELGFTGGRLSYTHGLPFLAFPHEKYNREGWPAEIMPILGGKKLVKPRVRSSGWQPCYSNPRTAEIALENIRAYLKKHPETLSISLGVNDGRGYCECEKCLAMDANAEKPLFSNDRGTRSPSYYTFVNRIAESLEKDYPDLKIGLLAYTGTIVPPPFPVHRNVVPVLTLDLLAASQDEATFQRQHEIIRRWHGMVPYIGTWDYYWGRRYYLPRVNFEKQAERLKFLHAHGGEAYFGEATPDMADGPKVYLTSRLLQDTAVDPEAILREWYERFAGKAAAPVLRGLYDKCRDFWYTEDMRRSPYYASRGVTYAYPSDAPLYAVREGLTRELLADAQKVAALARTPGEKRRAEVLVRQFEILDCHVTFAGYDFCDSQSGDFASAARAAACLDSLVARWDELMGEWARATGYFRNPDYDGKAAERYLKGGVSLDLNDSLRRLILCAGGFGDDPAVKAALKRLSALPGLPEATRKLVATLDAPGENVFPNVGFARAFAADEVETTLAYEITDEVLYKGEKTLRIWPARYKGLPNPKDNVLFAVPAFALTQKAAQGDWMADAAVMTPAKGKGVDVQVWCRRDASWYTWANVSYTMLQPGEWRAFKRVGKVDGKSNGLGILVRTSEDFGPDDCIYIGGIRLSKAE